MSKDIHTCTNARNHTKMHVQTLTNACKTYIRKTHATPIKMQTNT